MGTLCVQPVICRQNAAKVCPKMNSLGKEQPETWIHSNPRAMRKTVGLSHEA